MRTMTLDPKSFVVAMAASVAIASFAGCAETPSAGGSADRSSDGSTSVTGPEASSHGGPVRDHVSFVDQLRAAGVRVEIIGSVSRSGLSSPGTRLRLTGRGLEAPVEVESYGYDQADLGQDPVPVLREDISRISPDGRLDGTSIPRSWFRAERLLVAYAGSSPPALALFDRVVGPPFAGPEIG